MTAIHPSAPNLRRAYADVAHGQVHYYDSGGDGVPLLLLHQSPASSSDWFGVIPHFTGAGLRVIAMDNPGMGLSDPFPQPPTIRDFADILPVVLDHAGAIRADLLGHHTGVQIAIETAIRHPTRVRSASLYGVPIMSVAERQRFWDRIVPRQIEGALHEPVSGGSNLTEHFARLEVLFGVPAAQRLLLGGLLAGPLWWHGHNAALRHDAAPGLREMTQPLLLISHPGDMLEDNTRRAAELRPDAAYRSLPIEAPMAMDAAPEGLAAAVLDFLGKVAGR